MNKNINRHRLFYNLYYLPTGETKAVSGTQMSHVSPGLHPRQFIFLHKLAELTVIEILRCYFSKLNITIVAL